MSPHSKRPLTYIQLRSHLDPLGWLNKPHGAKWATLKSLNMDGQPYWCSINPGDLTTLNPYFQFQLDATIVSICQRFRVMLDPPTIDAEPRPDEPGALATLLCFFSIRPTDVMDLVNCSISGSRTESDTSSTLKNDFFCRAHISLHIPTTCRLSPGESDSRFFFTKPKLSTPWRPVVVPNTTFYC